MFNSPHRLQRPFLRFGLSCKFRWNTFAKLKIESFEKSPSCEYRTYYSCIFMPVMFPWQIHVTNTNWGFIIQFISFTLLAYLDRIHWIDKRLQLTIPHWWTTVEDSFPEKNDDLTMEIGGNNCVWSNTKPKKQTYFHWVLHIHVRTYLILVNNMLNVKMQLL